MRGVPLRHISRCPILILVVLSLHVLRRPKCCWGFIRGVPVHCAL